MFPPPGNRQQESDLADAEYGEADDARTEDRPDEP
jgi:hypothetical protein